ncbi:hypothetical protein Rs2_35945 [Raphanus sativus]|nr:hypothetical protein Rs2_35945 [Raphanus sativus]
MDPTELKRVFQMFDKNGDGSITNKELSETLRTLGIYIPDKELTQMIEKIDVNGDGCVDIDEFKELYKTIMEGEDEEEEDMKEAFNVFDQNGDGFITVDELKAVLSSLGLKQGKTLDDCKKMIKQVDGDGDGRVNFKEFRQMMKALESFAFTFLTLALTSWKIPIAFNFSGSLNRIECLKMGREKSPGLKILWVWTLGTAAILVASVIRTRMHDMESMMNQEQAPPKPNQHINAADSNVTVLPESDREIARELK